MDADETLLHLRNLLHSRQDLVSDWEQTLLNLAQQARVALAASKALVALRAGEEWRIFVDSGEVLTGAVVGLIASTNVLEAAFNTGSTRTQITLSDLKRSGSMDRLGIHSVLAVPLQRHGDSQSSAHGATPLKPIGVLYLDRRAELVQFSSADEQLARDFAALAERSLTLIELLGKAQRERDAARIENVELKIERFGVGLDILDTRDPDFHDSVTRVLSRAVRADRITLLLQGPSGSGKTHLARRFHAMSLRKDRAFVTLDCGQASNADALTAELFGFAKRSGFTVDTGGRAGKALLADGGILFIDEINSMPLELQSRLLRLVEAGRYSALGSGEEVYVDVQIIAAANEDLKLAVRDKRFREDLYFRLSQLTLNLPDLSQRRADIVTMAEQMLVTAAKRFGSGNVHLSPEALALLEDFPWSLSGNIRGLEHTILRSVLLLEMGRTRIERDDIVFSELIETTPIPEPSITSGAAQPTAQKKHSVPELLALKIQQHQGVLARIAEDPELIALIGISGRVIPSSTLRQRLARLGLLDALASERHTHDATLEQVIAALKQHGNGVDAANALGLSRDRLVWRLRQAGLTIGRILDF